MRVLQTEVESLAENLLAETLGGLHVSEYGTRQGLHNTFVLIHADNGVRTGYRHSHGIVSGKGLHTPGNDCLAHQGANGIVDKKQVLAIRADLQSRQGAVVALLATRADVLHLGIGRGHLTYLFYKILTGDDYNLVHQRRAVECPDAVFKHRTPVHFQKLLGAVSTETASASSGQQYGYVHVF